MSTLSLRKIKHDSSAVDNITLDSTGNIGVAASALSNSRIFLGGGNNQTALLFSNNSNGVVPPDVFGGAIDMNHSAGACEVGIWNAYTANTLRSFAFYQRTGTTTKNELMRIDAAGRVTTPYQPSFLAVRNTTVITSNTAITFQSTQHNIGSCYNTSNGRFTAPVAGVYSITWGALSGVDATVYRYTLWRNDNVVNINDNIDTVQIRLDGGSGIDYLQGTKTINLYLQANDYLTVIYSSDNASSAQNSSWAFFSGHLVG